MAERKTTPPQTPPVNVEVAGRLSDPFETHYLGVLRTGDPLLLERGGTGSTAWDIYRDLKRDGKVFAGLQKRKLAVIGRPWQVQPVQDSASGSGSGVRDAQTVTQILKRMNFDAMCADLMDALLYGFVPAEIIWGVREGLIVPERVIAHRQRRFVYVQDGPDSAARLRLLTRADMIRGIELPARKFIAHRVNPEDDNPYGTGLGLQLYWPVFFKRSGILSWNRLNDRFGNPTAWGTYPANADKRARQILFEALQALRSDGVLMTPQGMDVKLLESKLTGSITTQQALVEYMDDWIAEVLLGQSPRGAAGGALAAASIEREQVRIELSQADSDLLSETLNNTLVKWLCELNGFAPCQVYRVIKKDEDLKTASETDVNVQSLGFRMTLDGVRAKYGEHWELASPARPANVPTDADGQGAGKAKRPDGDKGQDKDAPASFAENPSPAPTAADILAGQLGDAGDAVLTDWMARIKAMTGAASSPDELRTNITAAYGQLPTDQLARLIELALLAAELAGIYDATHDAAHDAGQTQGGTWPSPATTP